MQRKQSVHWRLYCIRLTVTAAVCCNYAQVVKKTYESIFLTLAYDHV